MSVITDAMALRWSLRWRHNGRASVSNHQPHDCLLNRLFRRRSNKTSKLWVTSLCVGNSPGTGEFPAQMASNAENVSIWWRHYGYFNDKFTVLYGHSNQAIFQDHNYFIPPGYLYLVTCFAGCEKHILQKTGKAYYTLMACIQLRYTTRQMYVLEFYSL